MSKEQTPIEWLVSELYMFSDIPESVKAIIEIAKHKEQEYAQSKVLEALQMSKEQTPIKAEYISLIQNQIDSIKNVLHVCDKEQKERLEFKITTLEDVKHLINNHSYK